MAISLPTSELSVNGSTLPIETVTVYRPSGAQVIRKLDVDLKVSAVNGIRFAFSTEKSDRIFMELDREQRD